MSEEGGSSSSSSCGCCGCLFTVVFGVVIISLLAGKFTVNDQTWNLDLLPPGLHSTPTEVEHEPAKVKVTIKKVDRKEPEIKTSEMNDPSTKPVRNEKVIRKAW